MVKSDSTPIIVVKTLNKRDVIENLDQSFKKINQINHEDFLKLASN